jgi:succinoglycan biosynthesis protein ExoM
MALNRSHDVPPSHSHLHPDASVVVASLTYKRPDTLAALLDAFARMDRPPTTRTTFLVVDNDENGSARSVVDTHRHRLGDIRYVVEPRRGIPVARNRAAREAMHLGADALCFIDDDEYPHRQWLARLVECWRQTGAQLIGGPVRVARPAASCPRWQRWLNRSLASRARRKNHKTARDAAAGRPYTIVTNNWLCDIDWMRRSGVRFDERILVSGGSDTAFYRAARAAGCVPCWCPQAIVYEAIEPDRLSLRYQFHRATSQSINHFRMKTPRITPSVVITTAAISAVRAVLSLGLLAVPVLGRASPLVAIRGLGWSVGRLEALCGRESRLYA